MVRGAVGRVGPYVLVLLAALTLNFALPRLAPGDPLTFMLGDAATTIAPAKRQEVLRQFDLDRSVPEQYVRYVVGVAHGDLGTSVRAGRPVTQVLAQRLPWTLALLGPSLLVGNALGTVLGILAAWHRGGAWDLGLLIGILAVDAMPAFWIGMLLLAVFSVQLRWLPSFGAVPLTSSGTSLAFAGEVLRRLALPVVTLTLITLGGSFLPTRSSVIAVMGEDYVHVAGAKGLSPRMLAFRHVLPNALLPVFTHVAMSVGAIFGGAVVIETVFAYPGLGQLIYQSVIDRDYPVLQGAFLLVALGVIAANLVADLAYPLIDPRLRRAT